MRKAFTEAASQILFNNHETSLFLGDIGVFGFRNILTTFPDRAFNFGILEQAMVSAAAGFSEAGLHPIVSTIAPFIVNRAFEQIKVDFGYQDLSGTFVSVGASFDYSGLGATHYCPEDVNLIDNIPGAKIYIPGNTNEVSACLNESICQGLHYLRLSETKHNRRIDFIGTQAISSEGNKLGVLFMGSTLRFMPIDKVIEGVDVFYSNEIQSLRDFNFSDVTNLVVVSDFYQDSIIASLNKFHNNIRLHSVEPRKEFYRSYGKYSDALNTLGCSELDLFKLLEILKNG